MNKITVKDFVEGYKKCATDEAKRKYLKSNLEIVKYVSYTLKDTIAKKIIEITSHEPDAPESESPVSKRTYLVDSAAKNMFFRLNIIDHWTNIGINYNNCAEEYDMLCESGLMTTITGMIPEEELGEFAALVEWAKDDFVMNELSTEAFVSKQFRRVVDDFIMIAKPIGDKIVETINGLDDKKVKGMLTIVDSWAKKK